MVYLIPCGRNEPLYSEVERIFKAGWRSSNRTCQVVGIHYIAQVGPEAQRHLAENRAYKSQIESRTGGSAVQNLFHRRTRACRIGDDNQHLNPCNQLECHFCSILKCSFRLRHVGSNMFGKESDNYVRNHRVRSLQHAVFLSIVTTGRSQYLYRAEPWRTSPDAGYDSVVAVTKVNGGAVENPETVVYQEAAIIPQVVVMYTRTHI